MYFAEDKQTNSAIAIKSNINDDNEMVANIQTYHGDRVVSLLVYRHCIEGIIKELEKIKNDIDQYEKQKAVSDTDQQNDDELRYNEFKERRKAAAEEKERRLYEVYENYNAYVNSSSDKKDWFDNVCEKIFGF